MDAKDFVEEARLLKEGYERRERDLAELRSELQATRRQAAEIEDVTLELRGRLEAQDRDSRTAGRDVREAEAQHAFALSLVEERLAEIRALSIELADQTETAAMLRTRVNQLEDENELLRAQPTLDVKAYERSLWDARQAAETAASDAAAARRNAQAQIAETGESVRSLENQASFLSASLGEAAAERDRLRAKADRLTSDLAEARRAIMTMKLTAVPVEPAADYSEELADARRRISELQRALAETRSGWVMATGERDAALNEVADLRASVRTGAISVEDRAAESEGTAALLARKDAAIADWEGRFTDLSGKFVKEARKRQEAEDALADEIEGHRRTRQLQNLGRGA